MIVAGSIRRHRDRAAGQLPRGQRAQMASRGGARENKGNLPQKIERLRRKGAKFENPRVGSLHRLPVFDSIQLRRNVDETYRFRRRSSWTIRVPGTTAPRDEADIGGPTHHGRVPNGARPMTLDCADAFVLK